MASKKTETGIVDFTVQKATKKPRIAFGSTLREYRLKAHLEQEQVGKACGVTGNAISNWERDVARPDASLVPTLCNLLNIPLYDFFGMENPNPYSSDEKALVADYRYMTDPNKRQLRSIVSAIIDSQEETRRENYRKNFCHLVGHDAGLAAGFGGPLDERILCLYGSAERPAAPMMCSRSTVRAWSRIIPMALWCSWSV